MTDLSPTDSTTCSPTCDRTDPHIHHQDDDRRYSVADYYTLTIPLISGKLLQSLNVHVFLRTLVDFLLLHLLQLRALQKREITFADLSMAQLQVPVLVVRSVFPKTTQAQYSACVRHRLVELCPHFALAMYLFARFHIEDTFGELDLTPACIHDRQLLDYKLLHGGKKLRPLLYLQQYKALTKMLKYASEFRPVHLGRILAAQYNADPRFGALNTNPTPMKAHAASIDALSTDVLCRLGGFASAADYYVERAARAPPEAVVRRVFPFLETCDASTPFFALLDSLRRSLVQDMAEVARRFPDNLLCEHPIFRLREFVAFAGAGNPGSPTEPVHPKTETQQRPTVDGGAADGTLAAQNVAGPPLTRVRELEAALARMEQLHAALAADVARLEAAQAAAARTLGAVIRSTHGLGVAMMTGASGASHAGYVLGASTAALEAVRVKLGTHGHDDSHGNDKGDSQVLGQGELHIPGQGELRVPTAGYDGHRAKFEAHTHGTGYFDTKHADARLGHVYPDGHVSTNRSDGWLGRSYKEGHIGDGPTGKLNNGSGGGIMDGHADGHLDGLRDGHVKHIGHLHGAAPIQPVSGQPPSVLSQPLIHSPVHGVKQIGAPFDPLVPLGLGAPPHAIAGVTVTGYAIDGLAPEHALVRGAALGSSADQRPEPQRHATSMSASSSVGKNSVHSIHNGSHHSSHHGSPAGSRNGSRNGSENNVNTVQSLMNGAQNTADTFPNTVVPSHAPTDLPHSMITATGSSTHTLPRTHRGSTNSVGSYTSLHSLNSLTSMHSLASLNRANSFNSASSVTHPGAVSEVLTGIGGVTSKAPADISTHGISPAGVSPLGATGPPSSGSFYGLCGALSATLARDGTASTSQVPSNPSASPSTEGSVAEVWDDYKNWELSLGRLGVSPADWLRGQPPATVSLHDNSSVLVRFIESVAHARTLPVSIVMEKLLRMMRQHTLPPTIVELCAIIRDGLQVDFD